MLLALNALSLAQINSLRMSPRQIFPFWAVLPFEFLPRLLPVENHVQRLLGAAALLSSPW